MDALLPSAWRLQPWKNGGGVTYELARADDGDGLLWRVSIAAIDVPGPFSIFSGIDRHIALWRGAGFVLVHPDGLRVARTRSLEPYFFSGDTPLDCTLVAGPVQDVNVMVRRAARRARLEVLDLMEPGSSDSARRLEPAPTQIVLVHSGVVEVSTAAATIELQPDGAVIAAPADGPLTVRALRASPARALWIRIE